MHVTSAKLTMLLAGTLWAAAAQEPPQPIPSILTDSLVGEDLYVAYCATCHGLDGRGNGPVASALVVTPADLTALSRLNGGTFPRVQLEARLDGEMTVSDPIAHGSTEMPIWGAIFRALDASDTIAQVRVTNLVDYLEAIQEP